MEKRESIRDIHQNQSPDGKAKILVVDDNQEILKFFKIALTHNGYGVTTALGGREGLRSYQSDQPRVVLLDVNMPDLSGIDTLRSMRELDTMNRSRIIMLTGHSDLAIARRAMELGAYDYITKPFNLKFIHSVVDQAMNH